MHKVVHWSLASYRSDCLLVGDEFYTRAKLVGVFVDHDGDRDRSLDKIRKIYGLGAPTTTLTSSNNFHFVDDRSSDSWMFRGL